MSQSQQVNSKTPAIYTLSWQKLLLGMALSEHPIQRITPWLVKTHGVLTGAELKATTPGQTVKVAGIVKEIRHHRTSKNQPMLFVTLEDASGEVRVTVFPKTLSYTASVFLLDSLVIVRGKASHRTEHKRKKDVPKPTAEEDSDAVVEEEESESMNISYEVLADHAEFVVLE